MLVPVVLHKDKDSDYGVTVPDFPGCFSAGDTVEDALSGAREAIELHLEGILADGEAVPQLFNIEDLQAKREYKGGVWHLVDIDPTKISGQAQRINVTIPIMLLGRIDDAAKAEGTSRSAFLTSAAMEHIAKASLRG
jgi:predicted RNase H-like HicB family nuclease